MIGHLSTSLPTLPDDFPNFEFTFHDLIVLSHKSSTNLPPPTTNMTTAHRPTFDPVRILLARPVPHVSIPNLSLKARGKEALRGPAYHQRLLPAHTQLKFRQAGQGGDADDDEPSRDLAAELLAAEAAHFAKTKGQPLLLEEDAADTDSARAVGDKRRPSSSQEDYDSKRRRILEETRALDADDSDESGNDGSSDSDDDDDDDDDDDEEAELARELERVRREREEKKKREEAERAKEEEEAREKHIALGNPLLNKQDFTMKRRWDDDVVFKNQARGTEDKGKKEFVNDLLRSDFHRRFMSKYVR
ncbi:complexed with cef1p [Epichloe festucae Fl1]|uniref:Complexed with cef1p n=1 Tax=Epichloe festucae (strain Fl1) TaxID=877507 RepID=A0A7U3Q1U0_EPIFF|nr:complexed with cef1p [Epichloe festucae Fl1]